MKEFIHAVRTPLIASLTLGLAPFSPEPHVIGKIRWVAGGAVGMEGMDWLDLAFHGIPWVWLIVATILAVVKKLKFHAQPQ